VRLTDHKILLLLAYTALSGMLSAAPNAATNTASDSKPIDLPVPVGEPVKGIKIPQYDETGKLTMNLSAETARKLDDTHVELEGLKVTFSDKEEKEIVVEIPRSLLDLQSRVLKAESKTVISREDFDICGEGAEFDTATRSGSFKGRVRASFRNDTPSGLQP
jgi:hypothetical protein